MSLNDYKLCYVGGCFAYFTTQALKDQWGDDWDDVDYKCNAGEPYKGQAHDILTVAFEDWRFKTPCDHYSVAKINAGAIAWLVEEYPEKDKDTVVVPAGTTLREFVRLMEQAGSKVYFSIDHAHLLEEL